MANIADLIVRIGADSSNLSSELSKSKEQIQQTFSGSPVKELNSGIDEVTGKITGMTASLTKLAGIAAGGFGLNAVVQGAVNAGEAVYQLGLKYNITAAQAGKLSAIMKLTGGDVDTAASAIMRLDKTLSASGEAGNKARTTLQQMGVSMTDSNGRLKPLNEQLAALAKGYQTARAAGQGQEFLMNTLGVRGMALTKTLLNYSDAAERASKIKGVGLDPEQMHKAYMNMQEVNMQFSKLGVVAGSALAPLVSEILPPVQTGLAKVAALIAQNKTLISGVIVEGTKLLALYKAVQLARKGINAGKDMYDAAKTAVNAKSGSGISTAAEEKQLQQLSKAQQRYINKSIADSDKMYQKRRKEAIATAKQENMSAKETQAYLSEQFTLIGNEAAAAAERIRISMTEAFQQANVAAAEAAAGIKASSEEVVLSNAQVSESEAATGTAAEEAAIVKQEANIEKTASNEEVVASNAEVAESETATGATAEESAAVKAEANAAKIASNEEVVASNTTVAETETAAGTAATVAGEKSVAAKAAEQGAATRVEGKVKEVSRAHVASGSAAVNAGSRAVGTLGKVASAAKSASSVLFAMAGGWMGVAAAALYAAYCAWKYFHAKYEAAEANTWTGDAGYGGGTYTLHDGRIYKKVNNGDDDVAADPTGQGERADGGASEVALDPNSDEYAAVYAKFMGKSGSSVAAYEAQQKAQEAMDEANSKANDINVGFDDGGLGSDVGGGGGSGSGGGGGGSSSAAEAKPATPMTTWWSFENDPQLAQWANEIKYAANYWGVPADAVAGIIKQESGGTPQWSSDGQHWGLGQISEAISNEYGGGLAYGPGSDNNQNIMAVAGYLAHLIDKFGDLDTAISAYNTGEYAGFINQSYVTSVRGYMNEMYSKQVPAGSGAEQAQPVEYDVPVGELVAYHAIHDYTQGDQWRDGIPDDVADDRDTKGWCDTFTARVYESVFKQLGKTNPFEGSAYVNDSQFRAADAYVSGGLDEIRDKLQPGDLVDGPGHVGIYIGNGMVRSRQSSGGIHDATLEQFNDWFGIQGYGSISMMTDNMTVKSGLIGKTAVNQAAAEAAKRLEKAKADYAQILNELTAATHKPETAYEEGMLKILDDVYKKRKKIMDIDKVGGVDTSQAKKLLGEYKAQQIEALNKKIKESNDQLAADTEKVTAQVKGDYESLYDAELKASMAKLDKEKEARFKAVAKHKNDLDAQIAVEEWHEAESLALTKKREEERRKEFDETAQAAIKDLDTVRLYDLISSGKGKQSIYWDEKKKAMSTFYSLWKESSISTMGIANEAASSMASGLSSVFSDLGSNISNVGKLAQNMGKVILETITKIVAQWAAAKITMNLLGGFMGMGTKLINPTAEQWGLPTTSIQSAASGLALDTSIPFLGTTIPTFASGGKVTAPTLAMIGEGNDDEGIFPLNSDTYGQMARGIVAAQGNSSGNAPVVNIINNSSASVSVKDSHYDNRLRRWVLNAVVEDVNNNVDGSATNLKAALGVR